MECVCERDSGVYVFGCVKEEREKERADKDRERESRQRDRDRQLYNETYLTAAYRERESVCERDSGVYEFVCVKEERATKTEREREQTERQRQTTL